MENRGRRCRETSPEREKVCAVKQRVVIKPTFRKVQVVYYLSRNGQLEHPHYMEVAHLSHQHLRLKDVIDRLTVLRGKGMPSLYSWSCKRSYKNGYVWNDLTENDIIYPSEGAEYILKGSELVEGCTGKFQQLQLSNRSQQLVPDPTFHPKRKPSATKRHFQQPEEVDNNRYGDEDDDGNEEEEDDQDDNEDKRSYTSSMTPPQCSRCSRGVSTDESELQTTHKNNSTSELTLDNLSPPSTTATTSSVVSDKANESGNNNNNTSKRFEDGDPVAAESSSVSRNSVLLQLISCGGSTSFRGRNAPVVKEQQPPSAVVAVGRKSGSSLHKGVLYKTTAAAAAKAAGEDEMIRCMSENPRFGNLQAEEKEYFSGSIVESMAEERVQAESAGLKRSSSYNEERNFKAEVVSVAAEKEMKRGVEKAGVMRGKCIPMKKPSSKQANKSTR